MADDRRVEPRTVLVGRGMTTPERIAELEQRAKDAEKVSRGKPTRAFSDVLGSAPTSTPRVLNKKEQRLAALPKKGPTPGLVHPGQREAFGRDGEDSDETVVLKG